MKAILGDVARVPWRVAQSFIKCTFWRDLSSRSLNIQRAIPTTLSLSLSLSITPDRFPVDFVSPRVPPSIPLLPLPSPPPPNADTNPAVVDHRQPYLSRPFLARRSPGSAREGLLSLAGATRRIFSLYELARSTGEISRQILPTRVSRCTRAAAPLASVAIKRAVK